MAEITLKGSCLCGAVAYEATGEATRFLHCHCSRCRKATGTGHASNLFLQPSALRWLSGEDQVRTYKVPTAKRGASSASTMNAWRASASARRERSRFAARSATMCR